MKHTCHLLDEINLLLAALTSRLVVVGHVVSEFLKSSSQGKILAVVTKIIRKNKQHSY